MGELGQTVDDLMCDVARIASGAPSYGGQFGPKVEAIGAEAVARLRGVADALAAREEYLVGRADAFEMADMEVAGAIQTVSARVAFPEDRRFLKEQPCWVTSFLTRTRLPAELMQILGKLAATTGLNTWDDLLVQTGILGMLFAAGELRPASEDKNVAASVIAGSARVARLVPAGPVRGDTIEWLRALLGDCKIWKLFVGAMGSVLGLVCADGLAAANGMSPPYATPTAPASTPTPTPPSPTPTPGAGTPMPSAESASASPTPTGTASATPAPSATPSPSNTPTAVPILPTNTPDPNGQPIDARTGIEAVVRAVDWVLEQYNLFPSEPSPLDPWGMDLVDPLEGIPSIPVQAIRGVLYAAGTLKGLLGGLLERVSGYDPMYPLPEPVPTWPGSEP